MTDPDEPRPWGVAERLRLPYYYYGVALATLSALAAGVVEPTPLKWIIIVTTFATVFMAAFLAVFLPPPGAGAKNGPMILGFGVFFLAGAIIIRLINN